MEVAAGDDALATEAAVIVDSSAPREWGIHLAPADTKAGCVQPSANFVA